MPAIAIGGAIAGGAAIAAGTVEGFALIGAIGAVAAGVGVVTGSKDLQKIGGIMGAVGGVGAFASSTGMFSGATAAADGASAAEAGATIAPDAGSISDGAAAGATDAASTLLNPPPAPADGLIRTGSEAPPDSAGPQPTTGNENPLGADKAISSSIEPPAASTTAQASAPSSYTPAASGAGVDAGSYGVQTSAATSPWSLGGIGSGVMQWVQDNPRLAASLATMAGNTIAGYSPLAQAQVDELNSRTAANKQRIAALTAAQPRIGVINSTRRPVFGTGGGAPTYAQPNVTTGLINGVPV